MKYNEEVYDFWQYDFSRQREREQDEQLLSTYTRVQSVLSHPNIRRIIGQKYTTINFSTIIEQKQILFARLSAGLPEDQKRFVGIIILNELLHAVRKRIGIPEDERHQFCVFVDEFQNYASSEDFQTLFNESRKLGISSVIAHQERFGQFADNKKITGATAASVNKIAFQLTPHDAQELAIEFARRPPTEMHYERELVITQYPFYELIKGHKNPKIQDFVNTYLRRWQDRIEDLYGEIQGEQIKRMIAIDDLSIARIEERAASIGRKLYASDYDAQFEALRYSSDAVAVVRQKTFHLLFLHQRQQELRLAIRTLNRFLTALMEKRVKEGQEEFAHFLISCLQNLTLVSRQQEEALKLYISFSHGDPGLPRAIPFSFAQRHGLFTPITNALELQIEENNKKAITLYTQQKWENFEAGIKNNAAYMQKSKFERITYTQKNLNSYALERSQRRYFDVSRKNWETREESLYTLVGTYIPYLQLPYVTDLIDEYTSNRFTSIWKRDLPIDPQSICEALQELRTPLRQRKPFTYETLERFSDFLNYNGEGAVVALAVLRITATLGLWRDVPVSGRYPGRCMLEIPTLDKKTPLEILLTMEQITQALKEGDGQEIYKYLCATCMENGKEKKAWYTPIGPWSELQRMANYYPPYIPLFLTRFDNEIYTRELKIFQKMAEQDPWFIQNWPCLSHEVTRLYFFRRASDLFLYGSEIADITFPQSVVPGMNSTQVREMVDALVQYLTDHEKKESEKEIQASRMWTERSIQDEIKSDNFRKQYLSPIPATLPSRLYTNEEVDSIIEACLQDLNESSSGSGMVLRVIEDFVSLCRLLSMPENHIETPSGQYIRREVYSRASSDMATEMAQELVSLNPYHAYAKILSGDDKKDIQKPKITTNPLPKTDGGMAIEEAIAYTREQYCVYRDEIDAEIRQRRTAWREAVRPSPHQGQKGAGEPLDDAPPPHT